MSPAARQSASGRPVRAFAPSHAERPLLRERLRELGLDVPVHTPPVVSQPGGACGHALLWSWTASGIEELGSFAEICHDLDMVLLVGIARWVPLDTALGVLASAGLTPRAATPIDVGGRRGLELRLTRDEVPATRSALALLELVTWSASWHRGRQQPLRVAIEGAVPHDLRDHPYATDARAVWRTSPAALRLASPEIVLVGEQAQPDPAVREVLSEWGTLEVECLPTATDDALGRPTLAAETLLLAPRGIGAEAPSSWAGSAASAVATLQQLAAGTPVDLPPAVRRQLAPEVLAAADSPDLGAASAVQQVQARTRLRWSVLRHHSAVGLTASLEARTGRALTPRPRLTLCLDARTPGHKAAIDAAVRQLAAQRRRPDEVILITADGADADPGLNARLQHALGIEPLVGTRVTIRDVTGDLVIVMPLDAQLATDALADLELAYLLWSTTVSVIPTGFVVDDAGRLHQTPTESPEGLGVPATIGVVAIAGRELRAHWRTEEVSLERRDELVADAVQRGAMIYTMPSLRAVFHGTPATLRGALRLDLEADVLLIADGARR